MSIYSIAPNIAAVLLGLLGAFALIFPNLAAGLVSLKPVTAEGVSEIRATLGCFFLGLSMSCVWLQSSDAFTVVGIASVGAAVTRLVSLFLDKSITIKNIGGVIAEALLGILFLLANYSGLS